jgi:hypothetical protein
MARDEDTIAPDLETQPIILFVIYNSSQSAAKEHLRTELYETKYTQSKHLTQKRTTRLETRCFNPFPVLDYCYDKQYYPYIHRGSS